MGQNENRFFNKRLQLCKRGRRDFEVGGVSAGRKPRLAATLQKTFCKKSMTQNILSKV